MGPTSSAPPLSRLRRFKFKAARAGVPLSKREQQVLWMMCEGFAPVEIAAALHRAHQTIATYRKNLRWKTRCRTDAQLGAWAVRQGLA